MILPASAGQLFSQFQDGHLQGWQSETAGYLSEGALVTSLAMFERRFATNAKVSDRLKPYLRKAHSEASKYLARHFPDFDAALVAVDIEDWG